MMHNEAVDAWLKHRHGDKPLTEAEASDLFDPTLGEIQEWGLMTLSAIVGYHEKHGEALPGGWGAFMEMACGDAKRMFAKLRKKMGKGERDGQDRGS
jgi:hypothetical protein